MMPILELPIPPGFTLETGSYPRSVARVERVEQKVRFYLYELRPGRPFRLNYFLRARSAGRVQMPPARIYLYYHPKILALSHPFLLTIR